MWAAWPPSGSGYDPGGALLTDTNFLLRGRRILTPDGIRPAGLEIRGGRIARILGEEEKETVASLPVVEANDWVVLPGLVDTHVHINAPGRAEWEGFETATRAAAAGGVTTLLDMPLNSIPPTTSVNGFCAKLDAAAGGCQVHVGFWGGLVPGNLEELEPLRAGGAFGFKCFLAPSGVPEFGQVEGSDLRRAMSLLARTGTPLLVHAESGDLLAKKLLGKPAAYASYLASRPRAAENEAVARMIRRCRETGARVHILHLSSAEALEPLERARHEGLPVSAETCPHYLTFAAEEIPDGATEFKCAPPIRERANRERLWQALQDGTIGMIVSDHSPSPPELKHTDTGDFALAWGGISSLELSLSAVWTGARQRGFSLERVAEWMCGGPARLSGLSSCKGSIAIGQDADLVLFDPEARWVVEPERLHHRHKLTPYAGRVLEGRVQATFLRGEKIYESGRFTAPPRGEILLSGSSSQE